ncbi:hypothetical protein B0T24DRAFT_679623 [Lasiosphaeria ovina]|uniref:Uncharacterized protein n=1 Tax=Lasiosphaeria ovina TaxID=92902 RepID=A0AAE0N9D0_9PEZI|nr:hypothetical protein B0T24DRAFT_679623 [Lasiosphaeria ovina]
MADPGHRKRGLKAATNPRVSEKAKQRDRGILENEFGDIEVETTAKVMPATRSSGGIQKSASHGEMGSASTPAVVHTSPIIKKSASDMGRASLSSSSSSFMHQPSASGMMHEAPVQSSSGGAHQTYGMSRSTRSHDLGGSSESAPTATVHAPATTLHATPTTPMKKTSRTPTPQDPSAVSHSSAYSTAMAEAKDEAEAAGEFDYRQNTMLVATRRPSTNPRDSEKAEDRDRRKLHDMGEV